MAASCAAVNSLGGECCVAGMEYAAHLIGYMTHRLAGWLAGWLIKFPVTAFGACMRACAARYVFPMRAAQQCILLPELLVQICWGCCWAHCLQRNGQSWLTRRIAAA
jgi:hypothetical protein